MEFHGTNDELDQTIAAWRSAAAEYRRLAALVVGHRERGGSSTQALLAAADQSQLVANQLGEIASYRDLAASGGIANAKPRIRSRLWTRNDSTRI